ncbi:MAG TPA: methyltransferase domain-containing protein [Fimbriimonas sp.]
MPSQWQRFFDAHAPHYDENVFAQNTVAEVDFLITLFALPRGASILDVGCGTGRHSVELARRGYSVTGLDLSEGMISVARAKAEAAGVAAEFVQGDATAFDIGRTFDAAICLCEGAVGLIEQGMDAEVHDLAIFENIARHLKPHGPFLLTALNGYLPIRQMNDQHVREGRFDPATMVAHYEDSFDLPEGQQTIEIYERLFIPPEVARMLRQAGFRVDRIYGGTAGNWGHRPLSLDEIEAMYVCRRGA